MNLKNIRIKIEFTKNKNFLLENSLKVFLIKPNLDKIYKIL